MNPDILRTVRGYFLQGAAVADIEEKVKTDWPKEDSANIIRAVLDDFATTGRQSKATIDGFCIDAARDLYRRMLEVGDFAGALSAIKELARLRQKTNGSAGGDDDLDSILSGLNPDPPARKLAKPTARKRHVKRKPS